MTKSLPGAGGGSQRASIFQEFNVPVGVGATILPELCIPSRCSRHHQVILHFSVDTLFSGRTFPSLPLFIYSFCPYELLTVL